MVKIGQLVWINPMQICIIRSVPNGYLICMANGSTHQINDTDFKSIMEWKP